MTRWALVAAVVAATTAGEVLQAFAMRRHGEVRDFRPGALGRLAGALARNGYIVASVGCMAVSFFAFLALVSVADLSFAVPATAASYVLQTILAKHLLREAISPARWMGVSLVACGVALLSL
jgi:drug/metabolite transporter (DMT)-like permease